jgi:riboflavin synthase
MAKFKSGEKVICNGNCQSYVLNYYTDKMVEVRLWSNQRHVGDVVIHEDELVSNLEEIKEIAEDFAD